MLLLLLISRGAHGLTAELESLQTCSVTIPLTDLSLVDCATSMVSTFGVMNSGAINQVFLVHSHWMWHTLIFFLENSACYQFKWTSTNSWNRAWYLVEVCLCVTGETNDRQWSHSSEWKSKGMAHILMSFDDVYLNETWLLQCLWYSVSLIMWSYAVLQLFTYNVRFYQMKSFLFYNAKATYLALVGRKWNL